MDKGENQDHIFYFPVSNKDKIKFLIYVIYANNECSSGCTTTYVDELNRLAINGNQSSCLLINDQNGLKCLTKDNSTQFNNYLKEIKKIYKTKWTPSFNNSTKAGSEGFSVKHEYEVRMNVSRTMTSQNGKPICWAACITTIIKYRNYSKYKSYTAEKVASESGVGVNYATDTQTLNAISKYYKGYKSDNVLWYPTYSQLMRDGKPVMIKGRADYCHFVLGIGFKAYGGYRQAVYFNPQNMSINTFEYKDTNTTMYFAGDRYVYKYIGSLHN